METLTLMRVGKYKNPLVLNNSSRKNINKNMTAMIDLKNEN